MSSTTTTTAPTYKVTYRLHDAATPLVASFTNTDDLTEFAEWNESDCDLWLVEQV